MRSKKTTFAWAVVLSVLLIYSSLMCLVTAFSLPVDAAGLMVFCLICGAGLAGLSLNRHGTWIKLGILLGGLVLFRKALMASAEVFIYRISQIYDLAYGWGVVYWTSENPGGTATLALCAVAGLLLWLATDMLMHRRPAGLAVIAGIVPLLFCMVVTDTVPDSPWLFGLVFSLLLILLTQTTRRREEGAANRLTAMLLIPALLCTGILFWAVPRDSYAPPQAVPGWLESLFSAFNGGSGSGIPNDVVDLANMGPKFRAKYVVMEVTGDQGGVLYLRGQSYDTYDGLGWSISDAKGDGQYWPNEGLQDGGTISIYLRQDHGYLFLPYYADQLSGLEFGRYSNSLGRQYSVHRTVPYGPLRYEGYIQMDAVTQQCLQLPATTQSALKEFLNGLGITEQDSAKEKATVIGQYVQNMARYDLYTEKMPKGEEDFVLWFLRQGEEGYCVHFATVATALLRAAGVPARYVTGYLTQTGPGKTEVREEDSHAWVEYLDPQRGWTVLDPTPAEGSFNQTDPTQSTAGTAPTETEPTQETATQATQPTQETEATRETTLPAQTTAIGGGEGPERDITPVRDCLLALAYVLLAVASVWGQYILRLNHRRKKRCSGSPNGRALAMWKEIAFFRRLYRRPVKKELLALAEKARFSQHTLSAQELMQLRLELQSLSRELNQMKWYMRLAFKLIFAAE